MDEDQHINDQENSTKELEDSGITMVDVLQEEEELENNAEAVLGAGDDSVCTYNNGYVKRQPLYACLTCCAASNDSNEGGICLGCSYHCHEGHELVELYTKRFFRCDCGNSKFPTENPCKLYKEKSPVNVENSYNQNFKGKYCTCSRPYPDPEDTVEDNMIQCIICEDWHHGRHLKVENLPLDEDFSEMICYMCVSKLPFLKAYLGVTTKSIGTTTGDDVDVTAVESKLPEVANNEVKLNSESTSVASKDDSVSKGLCKLIAAEGDVVSPTGTLFFKDNWRKELCVCSSCDELYRKLKVSFLIDEEDTVSFYESEGRAKRSATAAARGVQREIDALSSLDRITRTELVHEYNNLSTSLREYLKKFAENGKVVRDEDIREFFSELSANKKQKKDEFQYFCK